MNNSSFNKGIFFVALALLIWGILPLYWRLLVAINPLHILSFRIICSLLCVGILLAIKKNSAWLTVFKDRKKGGLMILAGLAISINWGLYIWAVNNNRTIEASMGFYISPLISIALGLIFFREKLKRLQWIAFGMATLGVLILTILSGSFPWISITLAMCFGFYGLFKKKITLSSLESLGSETLVALPMSLFFLLFQLEPGANGLLRITSGWQTLSYFAGLPVHILIILSLCGVITAFPLYCFTKGAKILPLSTLGFLQFFSPTFQFFLGYFLFGEYFPARYFIAFAFIWAAVIIYIISLRSAQKGKAEKA